jgi:hypothetical protein
LRAIVLGTNAALSLRIFPNMSSRSAASFEKAS